MLAAIIPFAMVDLLSVQVFGVAIAIILDALIVPPVLPPRRGLPARPLELVAAVAPGADDSGARRSNSAGNYGAGAVAAPMAASLVGRTLGSSP